MPTLPYLDIFASAAASFDGTARTTKISTGWRSAMILEDDCALASLPVPRSLLTGDVGALAPPAPDSPELLLGY